MTYMIHKQQAKTYRSVCFETFFFLTFFMFKY